MGRGLRADLKSLKLDSDPTLMGLYHFLRGGRGLSVPATLEAQLAGLCAALDLQRCPDPDDDVYVSTNTKIKLREIDSRFSHSVGEGFHFIRKHRCLTPNEVELLKRLEIADDLLSSPAWCAAIKPQSHRRYRRNPGLLMSISSDEASAFDPRPFATRICC